MHAAAPSPGLSIPAAPTRRPTRAVVDLAAIRANVRWVRERVSDDVAIMAVVKADAYGHGMAPVARAAMDAGADALGVATVDEALDLRETAGFERTPILLAGPSFPADAEPLQRARIAVTIGDVAMLRRHLAIALKVGRPPQLHVKLDTGMGRHGFPWQDLSWVDELSRRPEAMQGLFTHFAVSDSPHPDDVDYTIVQRQRFERVASAIWKAGYRPAFHAANSGAVLGHPDSWFDLVRPGVILYGAHPDPDFDKQAPLRPAMELRTRLMAIHDQPAGASISYGRRYMMTRDGRVGILPIGYGDGLPRILGDRGGEVLVRGQRAPIAGRICMDQTMVDLSGIPDAAIGDEVVVYGSQGGERISLEEVARKVGTIPYEITCQLGGRVPRVHVDSEAAEQPGDAALASAEAPAPAAPPARRVPAAFYV